MIQVRNRCFGMAWRSNRPPFTTCYRRRQVVFAVAVCFALTAFGGAASLFGQETAMSASPPPTTAMRITPDEAVELAIKNNLSLESSRISTETKKRNSDVSWNQFIPSVTLGGSLSVDNEKTTNPASTATVPVTQLPMNTFIPGGDNLPPIYGVTTYQIPEMELPQWHVAGNIQVQLRVNAAMFENMRRLRLQYEGGLLSYEKAKVQTERDIRKSYYSMLLLTENIALLRENFEAANRRVETAQASYRAGYAPELTLLQAQVSRENLKPNIDQAENGLKLAMAQFAMTLGLPYDTVFEFTPLEQGNLAMVSLDMRDLIAKAASGKLDIQEIRQQILIAESGRKAQIYQSLTPSLNLSWSSASAFIRDPWKDDWGNKDNWKASGSLSISLGISLDSFLPWSSAFQGVKDTDDQLKTAKIGLAQAIRASELEIYNTVLSLEKIQTSLEAQAQTISLAERSYRLTEDAYRAGSQDLLEVQNAELSLRQARVQLLEQQFNYFTGLIDLEYAVGVPFGSLSGAVTTRSE